MKKSAKFKPGQSGNPGGRKPGSRNKSTDLREKLGDDLDKLVSVALEKALAGDMVAMRIVLDRAMPLRKAVAPPVRIPGLSRAKTLTEKAERVLSAVALGKVSPDIGAALISSISSVARVIEIDALERRLAALEESSERQST